MNFSAKCSCKRSAELRNGNKLCSLKFPLQRPVLSSQFNMKLKQMEILKLIFVDVELICSAVDSMLL